MPSDIINKETSTATNQVYITLLKINEQLVIQLKVQIADLESLWTIFIQKLRKKNSQNRGVIQKLLVF